MKYMKSHYDILIIGAGITGVAIAWTLAHQKPRLKVAVVEKENAVACHTSGRNSGVVHPGFNPKPGTLKARFCVDGNQRIREFCQRAHVPFKEIGLLVVARTPEECGTLEELYHRGKANGVPDLQMLSRTELKREEPRVKGSAALYAPTGAVVDSRRFVEALAGEASQAEVIFLFGYTVKKIAQCPARGYHMRTDKGEFKCAYLINAAGLYADRIAHMLGVGLDYTILPFRGEYYKVTARKAQLVRHLIYPVPDLNFPFLGIHFTPTVYGELKAGPNAVLALGRESYNHVQINVREVLAMIFDTRSWLLLKHPDFRRLAVQHLRTSLSREAFFQEASSLVEGLETRDLERGPLSGIRAQLVDRKGQLVEDMIVEKRDSSLHVLNVVSPGFTCALPFARYLSNLI